MSEKRGVSFFTLIARHPVVVKKLIFWNLKKIQKSTELYLDFQSILMSKTRQNTVQNPIPRYSRLQPSQGLWLTCHWLSLFWGTYYTARSVPNKLVSMFNMFALFLPSAQLRVLILLRDWDLEWIWIFKSLYKYGFHWQFLSIFKAGFKVLILYWILDFLQLCTV